MIQVRAILTGIFKSNEWKEQVRKEFESAMHTSVNLLKTEVRKETPVGVSGHLRQGIKGDVLSSQLGRVYVTGSAAKYGDIIELGRRPGPISKEGQQSIELWVRRKIRPDVLAVSRTTRRATRRITKIGKRGGNPRERVIKSVAFLVARKIRKKGFKGMFMFQKAEEKLRGTIEKRFAAARDRIERLLSD